MFTYQNEFDFLNKDIEVLFANNKTSKFNLSLEIIEATKTINLEYSTSLFKETTAKQILNHYINILKELSINPNRKIAEIPVLNEQEQNQVLYRFNNTYSKYPKEKTIAELIEEQALKTPEKIALSFEDNTLTFKELNDKSNMLAHYLRSQNLGRNDIVRNYVRKKFRINCYYSCSFKKWCLLYSNRSCFSKKQSKLYAYK